MNDVTVGVENLPNIFVDRINLYPKRRPGFGDVFQYRIAIKLCMYDHSPERSWYGREELSSMEIKLVLRGGEAADALNDGVDSLHDYEPSQPGVIVFGQNSFSIEEELIGYTKFSTIIEVTIPTPPNLNIYAACFISGLDFGSELFNKFYGPMTAEKIFTGGVANNQSGYFYYPDTNEEYAGPVHAHEGTYMEGSEHSERSHATLRYVSEEDYKLTFPIESDVGVILARDILTSRYDEARGRILLEPGMTTIQASTNITNQPQAQNSLANVNFEIREAIRRRTY